MKRWAAYVLLLPGILLVALFLSGVVNALVQSLGYIPALGLTDVTMKYYAEIFTQPQFLSSVFLSLWIALVSSVPASVFGVLVCAALTMGKCSGRSISRLVRLPILVPHTVAALFIIVIFSQSGLLSRALFAAGLIGAQENFPSLLFNADGIGIIVAYLWKEIPFVAYFVLALMSSVSTTLGEASENLGVSKFKTFLHVTLPLSMPAVFKAFIIIFAFSFGAYELPYLLGATLPRALPVQAYIEYLNPDLQHRPYAMAMNGVMLLLTLGTGALYYRLMNRSIGGMRGDQDG